MEGGEGGGILFFILWKKIFDEVSFYFIRDFFCSSAGGILFFMTFFSDAGGHLDLGINLEWPKCCHSILESVLVLSFEF
mgnify:CR=1 FL=1